MTPSPEPLTVPVSSTESLGEDLKAKVLIVDDDERTMLAVTTALDALGQDLVVARSGEEALRRLLQDEYAVILLDVHMPGMDGYETASLIRARRRTRHVPIVFLTAVSGDDSSLLQAYSAGAVDMVFKPVDPFILRSKVSVFVELYRRQQEVRREAEMRSRLQEENFRVRTEKYTAEQALRRSQERQEAILQSLPVCFHARMAEPPFAAVFVGGAVEQVTGFSAARFMEDPNLGFGRVHPEDADRVQKVLSNAVRTGTYSCEFRWRCGDGAYRTFLDQGVLAPAEDGRPLELFGTMVDVTEMRLLEQQLAQAQKMEAVGQLTGGVAHDFNNLLTVILGNVDLIGRHVAGNEKAMRQLSAMRHAAERGRSLTGQLLAFSRRQHLSPETLDITALIHGFETLLRRAVGEAIQLDIDLGDEPVVVDVDPAQLESSLLNLAVNARDAMPDGGTLTIRVRRVEAWDAPLAADIPDETRASALIVVQDSGVGMPTDVSDRAFEPFFTTKAPGKGSGLGLSQVYGFVRQSGGAISLVSMPGEGTKLTIRLPLSSAAAAAPRPPRPPVTATSGSETILVVEDDPAVLALAIEMLMTFGYRVITASDAMGALEILRRGEAIDLVFTDVVMPGGRNGVQLALEARQLRPDVKVLLTSGYTAEALSQHRLQEHDLPIIPKPFGEEDLAARIREVLDAPASRSAAAPA